MRKITISNILPGHKTAKDIYASDGRILLASGKELKKNYINKLIANGINEIYILDDISENIQVEDVVCENTRLEAKILIKNLIEGYTFSSSVKTGKIKEIVDKLIDELLSNKDILLNLSDIKSVDDYTFSHSVNVCILSLIIGIGLGYNLSRLRDLGVGAILHDIGKLRIPGSILKKPSQLTVEEFEEIKKHTIYGYEILKGNENISMVSAFIAFGHHERFDGSGYPLQLKSESIHQCARIVAVADVYDALTSDRVYRKKLKPHEAIEYILSLSKHHFDNEIVNSFIKYVVVFPVGTGVILNTKERGVVVSVNKEMPTKPVIRIVYSEKDKKVDSYYDIDLANKPNVFIVEACEL